MGYSTIACGLGDCFSAMIFTFGCYPLETEREGLLSTDAMVRIFQGSRMVYAVWRISTHGPAPSGCGA